MTVTHDSILKFISYRYGLGYLNKRHRYASNIGRSFNWENPDPDPAGLIPVPPPVTTPCDLQVVESPSAAEQAEGLSIGSPEIVDLLERAGYTIGSGDPTEIFSHPDSTVQRLKQQIDAAGVAP
jgi:hypothetical protein